VVAETVQVAVDEAVGGGERPARLPAPESIPERIAFALLATAATLTALNGLSMLAAAVPALAFAATEGIARLTHGALRLATAFAIAGVVARHLSRSRKPLLPNEREVRTGVVRLGGWVPLLAMALWLLPVFTLYELAPLRDLSTDMLDVLMENHVFEDVMRSPQMSGIVLLPIAASLAVPLFELATAAAFVVSSALLLLLLWDRSFRFPRAYLICVLLQAGLLFASLHGAQLASGVAQWVADEAGRNAAETRTMEVVRVFEAIQRYNTVLAATAHSLAWAFVGYALWITPLVLSARARETFALEALRPAEAPPLRAGIEHLPADERRKFYENAARTLQAPDTRSAAIGTTVAATIVAALVAALFLAFAVLRLISAARMSQPG
jgi:hypothetical protein